MRRRIPLLLLFYFVAQRKWSELLLLLHAQTQIYYKKDTVRIDFLKCLTSLSKKEFEKAFSWLQWYGFFEKIDHERIQVNLAQGFAELLHRGQIAKVLTLIESKYVERFPLDAIVVFDFSRLIEAAHHYGLTSTLKALQWGVRNFFEWNILKKQIPRWALRRLTGLSYNKQREYEAALSKRQYNYKRIKGKQREVANSYQPLIELAVFTKAKHSFKNFRWLRRLMKKIRRQLGRRDVAQEPGVLNQDVQVPTASEVNTYTLALQVQQAAIAVRGAHRRYKKVVQRFEKQMFPLTKIIKDLSFDYILGLMRYPPGTPIHHIEPELAALGLTKSRIWYYAQVLKHFTGGKLIPAHEWEEYKRIGVRFFGSRKKLNAHLIRRWKQLNRKFYKQMFKHLYALTTAAEHDIEGSRSTEEARFLLSYPSFWWYLWVNYKGMRTAWKNLKFLKERYSALEFNSNPAVPLFKNEVADFSSLLHTLNSVEENYRVQAAELLKTFAKERINAIYGNTALYKLAPSKEMYEFVKTYKRLRWLLRNFILAATGVGYRLRKDKKFRNALFAAHWGNFDAAYLNATRFLSRQIG